MRIPLVLHDLMVDACAAACIKERGDRKQLDVEMCVNVGAGPLLIAPCLCKIHDAAAVAAHRHRRCVHLFLRSLQQVLCHSVPFVLPVCADDLVRV